MSRVHDALSRARATSNGTEGAIPAVEQAGAPLFSPEGHDGAPSWASEPAPPEIVAAPPDVAESAQDVLAEPERRVAEKLVLAPDPDHASVEQYRRLAARLHLSQAEHRIKVVMIASALPGEGKT